jgi:hypothetical protein
MLIDAGAAFVFQTFEDPDDDDDDDFSRSSSGGGSCFIGTAGQDPVLNPTRAGLGIGMLSLVGIFLKKAGHKRKSVKRSRTVF